MILLLTVIALHSYLLTRLIFFPYPELFLYPYLTNIGLLPYKQIFDQHFPGLLFFPINFNNLGMVTPDIARVWLIVLVIVTHLLIFTVTRNLLSSSKKAVLANLIFLVWQPFLEGWTLWIDSFLAVFLISALYFMLDFLQNKRNLNLFLVGLLLSIAVVFKQVVLPLSVGVGFLVWFTTRRAQALTIFLLGFLPLIILMLGYFWWIGALSNFWFWTIIFNATTYAQSGIKGFDYHKIIKLVVIFSPVMFLPLVRISKEVKLWLAVFFLGSLGGILDRPDFIHFQPNLPITCVIICLTFFQLNRTKYGRIFLAGYIVITVWWLVIFYRGHLEDKVLFFDKSIIETAQLIKQNVKPFDEIYLFGPVPHLYQMTQTTPVGRIFAFQFPWFLKHTESLFLEALKENQPNLIVRDKTVMIEGQPITKFAARVDSYININYETFTKIGDNEFMRRKLR